ncbi:MAG: hypothetical protein MK102_07760 [Fuerstiella sp.]|nr:hypothetical protein [Fuerstiella sp.]
MSDDVLASFTNEQVAAFYRRLGEAAAVRGREDKLETSLAADLLLMWLNVESDNRNPYRFSAPTHLRESRYVTDTLIYHRSVFLSEEKARLGGQQTTKRLVGLMPRLEDGRWDGRSEIQMHYESLVEIPLSVQVQAYGGMASPEDFDLLTGLRGFQLRSEVTVKGSRPANSETVTVSFVSYEAMVKDRYDWNYNEYFTVPNPDYGQQGDGLVAPKQQKVRVYHKNAKRLEDAGLAKPFDLTSHRWTVTSENVTREGQIQSRAPAGAGARGR